MTLTPHLKAARNRATALTLTAVALACLAGCGTGATRVATPTPTGTGKDGKPLSHSFKTLDANLSAAGLPKLKAESFAQHFHAHLDIYSQGVKLSPPPGIGVDPARAWISPVHTHEPDGVIHVETPDKTATYTLDQFVIEWTGGSLSERCLFGKTCTGDGGTWMYFVNGVKQTGNPADIVLKAHEEIVMVFGNLPTPLPSSFTFKPGE